MFKLKSCGLHISFAWPYMLTLYFCLEGELPVLRTWSSVPRIGDTIALPELGGTVKPLVVYDVVWEGSEVPSVSVFVHHAKTEHPLRHGSDPILRRDGDGPRAHALTITYSGRSVHLAPRLPIKPWNRGCEGDYACSCPLSYRA